MTISKTSLESQVRPWQSLVLACGNPLRGDDGVGWKIAEQLVNNPRFESVNVVVSQQFLPEHAELLSGADLVVFVDCSTLAPHGEVCVEPVEPATKMPRIFTHHLDPASLLRLAADLYGRLPSRAMLVAVGGEEFEMVEELSACVAAAVPRAVEAIFNELQGQP